MALSQAQRSWSDAAAPESGVIRKPSARPWRDAASASAAPAPWVFPPPLHGYVCLLALASSGRAELSIALGRADLTLDRLVVIKRYAAAAAGRVTTSELELAAAVDHPNVVRTLCVRRGGPNDDDYVVTEYLDGVTLRELLAWATAQRSVLPPLAVRRILTGLLDAVRHGQRVAPSDAGRAACEMPIAASDVFLTYDGRVKVLGFKGSRQRGAEDAEPAVDALLSRHCAPGLRELLDRYSRDAWGSDLDALISSVAPRVRPRDPGGEARVALRRVMASVEPVARARRAGRLVAAFARHRSAPRHEP